MAHNSMQTNEPHVAGNTIDQGLQTNKQTDRQTVANRQTTADRQTAAGKQTA